MGEEDKAQNHVSSVSFGDSEIDVFMGIVLCLVGQCEKATDVFCTRKIKIMDCHFMYKSFHYSL